MAERLAQRAAHRFVHNGRTIYEWDQSLGEVNIYVPVPPDMAAKEIFCDITKQHLKFGRTGNPPFLDVRSFGGSHPVESGACACVCKHRPPSRDRHHCQQHRGTQGPTPTTTAAAAAADAAICGVPSSRQPLV